VPNIMATKVRHVSSWAGKELGSVAYGVTRRVKVKFWGKKSDMNNHLTVRGLRCKLMDEMRLERDKKKFHDLGKSTRGAGGGRGIKRPHGNIWGKPECSGGGREQKSVGGRNHGRSMYWGIACQKCSTNRRLFCKRQDSNPGLQLKEQQRKKNLVQTANPPWKLMTLRRSENENGDVGEICVSSQTGSQRGAVLTR